MENNNRYFLEQNQAKDAVQAGRGPKTKRRFKISNFVKSSAFITA